MNAPSTRPALAAIAALVLFTLATAAWAAGRDDIVIADFEGKDFGAWQATGTAFGQGPARGTLPGQMTVEGFQGQGLVNSFHGGDDSTGTLTSPPFRIERRAINFLIGGGKYPGETCINLVVDGKPVRTATGPNDRPGGSERLDWQGWNVAELEGKNASIEIVDKRTGGWGHINVDQIAQSDRLRAEVPAHRELVAEARFLHLPVKTGAPKRRMSLSGDGTVLREFDIELADGTPDFWAFCDLAPFRGRRLMIDVNALPVESRALDAITQGDEIKGAPVYSEAHRPQFHFTSRRGWLNDPNGLVYFRGEYHLFYQHNPYGWDWGNMHWGHAVSPDLVHWKELPIALYPRQYGDWAFSGSAVVDHANTGGFQKGDEPPLVAAFTSTGRGECIVFSNDRGRTWTEYEKNPVVKHQGRDPRLLWHEPTKRWVMAVYDELQEKRWIAFYTSADLKSWEFRSRIDGFYECPDLFALTVAGNPSVRKWVLYAADGQYLLGDFDGTTFQPDSAGKQRLWYGNFYAAQTYSDSPGGRRVQVGWGTGITFPGMPFNQQMTVPCTLTLRNTPDGLRMHAEPVDEIASLRGRKRAWTNRTVAPGDGLPDAIEGDLFEIRADLAADGASAFGFDVRGVPVVYDMKKRELACQGKTAPLAPVDGRVRLQVLVDRGSIEVFGNGGQVALSVGVTPADDQRTLTFFTRDGNVRIHALDVFALKSAWDGR
ncbi:MAG: glycoside hydrolase family 32 protein [Isosphaeraceae bacterium]|nr:glycoside hydrolase family 32 protein [Isosphaeraceae bacterium]